MPAGHISRVFMVSTGIIFEHHKNRMAGVQKLAGGLLKTVEKLR
jgi:hypothetical protein